MSTPEKQFTKEEAIAFHDLNLWKNLTDVSRAKFQIRVERLCMPFIVFHKSLENALGRPVMTHELALLREGLIRELDNQWPSPTFDEVYESYKRRLDKAMKAQPGECWEDIAKETR